MKKITRKWKRKDVLMLLERTELYLSSGLALDKTISIISVHLKPHQKKVLEQVHSDILSGMLLSRSLAQNIGLSRTIVGLIEQGELTGSLSHSIAAAHALLEKEDELYKKCMSALAYPVIIGVFASLLTIGLVRGIMPQIVPMLKSLNVTLPLLTRIVIFISENFLAYGVYAGVLLVTFVGTHSILIKKNRKYRSLVHNVLIRVPLVGKLFYSYSLSLFLQSCGVLIESGVPLVRAYGRTSSAVALTPLHLLLERETQNIETGISLGTSLAGKSKRIPVFVTSLILAGEASGSLGSSLKRCATILDRDMEYMLKRLTSLIEPVLMAGMGCVVGSIALSIMMPIYDVSKVLQQ